jgi:hypothetical protein
VLRYGAEAEASADFHADEPDFPRRGIELTDVARLGSEQGNPGNREGVRSIEVTIPRKLLQTGLALVDTPGVGGLDSAHAMATRASLSMAELVLFVSDASQPLTATEIDFLKVARDRCPNVVCVVTKTDIHGSWRRIVDLNRDMLRDADIPIDVIAVSSVLRQRATEANSKELNEESGYPVLLTMLRDAASSDAAKLAARAVISDVLFVVEQLVHGFQVERELLSDPESAAGVMAELQRAKAWADNARSTSAKWQQTLNDGVQDLNADLDHDFRQRIRAIASEIDEVMDANDPAKMWDDFEAWLHLRVAEDISSHHIVLAQRAEELAVNVGEHFAVDEANIVAAAGIDLGIAAPDLVSKDIGAKLELRTPGITGNALSAVRGSYGGLLMFGMFGQMVGLALLNPLTIVIGLGMGRSALKTERKRHLQMRQQQAKIAARKYLDDVSVEVGKVSRDTCRRVQRTLRGEFSDRADSLQQSIRETITTAEATAKRAGSEHQQRLADVEAEITRLTALRTKATAAMASAGGSGTTA